MGRLTLRAYVATILAAWLVIGGGALVDLVRMPHLLEWALFAALAMFAGTFTLTIASLNASISINDAFFMSAGLLFGPGPAALILSADTILYSFRKRHRLEHMVFNAAAPALSLWVATHVFFAILGAPPLSRTDVPL